jgi:hypothetical protein
VENLCTSRANPVENPTAKKILHQDPAKLRGAPDAKRRLRDPFRLIMYDGCVKSSPFSTRFQPLQPD